MGALAFLVACEAAPAGFSLCRASCMGNRRRAVHRSGVRPAFLRVRPQDRAVFGVVGGLRPAYFARVPCGLRKGAEIIRAFVEAKITAVGESNHAFQEKSR